MSQDEILKYTNISDGSITLYKCKVHYDQNKEPFAVVLTEAANTQSGIRDELISKSAGGVAQVYGKPNGSLYVFAEKINGNFEQVPFEIRTTNRNREAIPYLPGNFAEHQRKEVSRVEMGEYISKESQKSSSLAAESFSQSLEQYRNEYLQRNQNNQ